MKRLRYSGSPASHQSCCVCSLHHTLTVTLCDSRYNVISPVPGVSGWWWRLLGSALLAGDSHDRKRKKKCLSVMISGIFHTDWRSLSLCPDAHASLTEKLGPYVQPWNFSVWVRLSLGAIISARWHAVKWFQHLLFLAHNKHCIAFSTIWLVLQYCHKFTTSEWRGYVGRHFYCKGVTSGEAPVFHTCRLYRPLLSLQVMGKNKTNNVCHACVSEC